uniref:Uncharacterized protein n=1 Tax=Arundo donax TaxID=35708 RepID=A0A0A9FAE6_ARUDO
MKLALMIPSSKQFLMK